MSSTNTIATTTTEPAELLSRGVTTARAHLDNPLAVERMTAGIEQAIPSGRLAAVLALALLELAKPARIGDLEQVAAQLAEAVFDAAHDGCDDEVGCTGGGLPFWREYVDNVLMPVVREHAVPARVKDAHAEGYAEAVARLRDDARYEHWWTAAGGPYWSGMTRRHLADYLETVGPDGVDVTAGEPAAPFPGPTAP